MNFIFKRRNEIGIKKFSEEDERKIVEEYIRGVPVSKLIEKYGFKTKKSIIDKVKKYYPNNYKQLIDTAKNNRKNYSINLSKIDNEFNAYFLGLMLSDGYIQDDTKFGIQLTDKDCIEFISKITGKQYKEYDSKNEKHLKQYRIIFSDKQQVKNMIRLGVVKNKSCILKPPNLNEDEKKYIPYIIRGVIDGDGCIYTTSKGSVGFYICSMSYDFIIWIKMILEEKLFMDDIHVKTGNKGIWLAETTLQRNIFKLISLVYDKPYGMQRKYTKLRETFRDYNLGNQDFLLG